MKLTNFTCVLRTCLVVLLGLVVSTSSHAYSYAAAGKEPVIDGREAIMQALAVDDFAAAKVAVDGLHEEFTYLLNEHQVDLQTPMALALAEKDAAKVEAVMDRVVIEEIIRRLDGAEKNLGDYQVAKVLVVKSKLFLDLIMPKLDEANRQQATTAIQGVLQAIGNPGVFGVGQAPADPAAFEQQRELLIGAIGQLK
ncbi:hypothetical protein BIT28_13295 [Photobacterium proteolyticum]|uniref:Uncharacterized protein n=1 Tax=Photobacterium proteolyticum TaxID=1903952 RepID=A0A1Q9GKA0_9GAMM|nr:hypothetical protein [Photobacterium proteolyticum]OLQ74924.1 hypothetical protein BIT28_13295 [Photobacterium proteolyticum]